MEDLTNWNGNQYKTRVSPLANSRVLVEVTLMEEGQETTRRLDMTALDGPGYIDAARQWLIGEIELDLVWEQHQ